MNGHSPEGRQIVQVFKDISIEKSYAVVALGLLLTWAWMGFTEGYPAFTDGAIDAYAMAALLLTFAASLMAFGFVRRLDRLLAQPAFWICTAGLAGAACGLLFYLHESTFLDADASILLVRLGAALMGLSAAVLVLGCAIVFSCLQPLSMVVGFCISCIVMFLAYFSLAVGNAIHPFVAGVGFCLLPLIAALLLRASRTPIVERLSLWPDEPHGLANGYTSMCISFGVLFFAMAAKAAMEPIWEFAVASDISVAAILLVALLMGYLVAIKSRPIGTFKLLKAVYSLAVTLLVVCIALQRLSLDPYMTIAFNTDCVLLIMVLFVLTAFTASTNEVYAVKIVAIAFATAAVGMALGWVVCKIIYLHFDHDRVYFTIAIACGMATFSTIGFSSRNFPYLTTNGEAAKKMRRAKEAAELLDIDFNKLLADKMGLSSRESEVLELLVAGYNTTIIANKLHISYNTGRTHVRNVYKKLGVHSRGELLDACERFRNDAKAEASGSASNN